MIYISLATCINRPISNFRPADSDEWVQAEAEDLQKETQIRFKNAILRVPPTRMYNCHGTTFACRRTRVQDIGNPISEREKNTTILLKNILEDDNFSEIDISLVEVGDIVIYRDNGSKFIIHTGVVHQVDTPFGTTTKNVLLVLSKWGENGEYLHELHETPYSDNSTTEFWTERIIW